MYLQTASLCVIERRGFLFLFEVVEIICFVARQIRSLFVMCCAICYHLYNLKNVKNTHGGVLLSVKLQAFSKQFY